MTSGQRYCRVWMSSVKWCSTQVAVRGKEEEGVSDVRALDEGGRKEYDNEDDGEGEHEDEEDRRE